MVHFKRPQKYLNVNDQYWKLDPVIVFTKDWLKEDLDNKSIKFPVNASLSRLACITLRSQRGLLIYDMCSASELRGFCAERRIVVPDLHRCNKKTLIKILEQEDEKASFSLLKDLPAELRVHIYEWYFRDFRWRGQSTRPPITQVSRLLRHETLPLFCETARFEIFFDMPSKKGNGIFFARAPIDALGMVSKLHVSGRPTLEGISGDAPIFTFEVGQRGDDMKIQIHPSQTVPQDLLGTLQERVLALDLWGEDGKLRLQRRHYGALRRIFEFFR